MPPSDSPLTSCWKKLSNEAPLKLRLQIDLVYELRLPAADFVDAQNRSRRVAVGIESNFADRRVEIFGRGDVLQHVEARRQFVAVRLDCFLDRRDLDHRR